jgi:3-oxoacyl-[acyl-carrier-protein] synthase II
MTEPPREAWITGIGLVSSLGEGPEANWHALMTAAPRADTTTFAPFVVHPIGPVDFDKQIPKRGDQRQMELWQRIGAYAAGLALDSAGIKGNAEILADTDMIVAAGGGERDLAVDCGILSGMMAAADPGAFLNERLMNDLRPTLFLAQLSNLLAGNISIVHGVTGSSRTFMGEESAGIDAARIGLSRILAGQSEIALVGGGYNSERKEMLLLYEFTRLNLKERFAPVWERRENPGMALGSFGAFLVIESRTHAEQRGARPLARLVSVVSDRCRREPGMVLHSLRGLWAKLAPAVDPAHAAVLSGATGIEPITSEEREFLTGLPGLPVRATGTHLGHGVEAQFVLNIALAALAVGRGTLFPSRDSTGLEQPMAASLRQALVTGVGLWRGEGMALVEAIE